MPNVRDPDPEAGDRYLPDRDAPQNRGSRSAEAGREFLQALGSDLIALSVRLRQFLSVLHQRLRPAPRTGVTSPSTGLYWEPATRRSLRRLLWGAAIAGVAAMAVISGALLWALLGLPVDKPASGPQKPSLLLEAADGEPLGRVGPFQVANVPFQDFPPILIKAVLSTEDRRFYDNVGVDPLGILRAAFANRAAGGIVQGGSTITQQLVKLEYLDNDRSYVRKLREALMAIWLGEHLSKNEILTRYLNRVYLGDGAVGMAAAARLYFGKDPADLSLAQAAMLAGLIRAPSELDPLHHLAAAQARAATVLDGMVANHAIDAKAADAAKAAPAVVNPSPPLAPAASWFADWVAKSAAQLAGSQTRSVRVRTTLVPELQAMGQQVLDKSLAQQGRRLGVSQGALVAMRPDGAVVAMVGGRNYHASQFNRAVDANRQPGSAFKLFVYLAALRRGYTPQTAIDAGPVDIKGWQPQNFDNEHYGRITLAEAFARSVNTAAVRLAMDVGLGNVIAAARDLGITEPLPRVPSLALGTVGVSLLDMTGAFASVRADRMHVRPWGVAAIGEEDGSRMLATLPPLESKRTLDPYQKPLVALLEGVVEHGTGQAAALDGFAAGKTGTSQDYRDAWFIGFDDKLVVGIWLGNDNDVPMKQVVGGGLPASIWKEFMTEAGPLLDRAGTPVDAVSEAQPGDEQDTLGTQAGVGSSEPGACDYQVCSSFYHSFRASDCTYQPYYGGPRQICAKGGPPPSLPEQTAGTIGDPASPASCNIELCARTYSSFRPSDCTYEPLSGGPRTLCTK